MPPEAPEVRPVESPAIVEIDKKISELRDRYNSLIRQKRQAEEEIMKTTGAYEELMKLRQTLVEATKPVEPGPEAEPTEEKSE